ncbi:MAG: DUF2314 domain-containing protein [Henriciella sp.]|nr:DUF2314 domain-containing protein [Henriciella sp.]
MRRGLSSVALFAAVAACSGGSDTGDAEAPLPPLIETDAPELPDQPPLYNYASIKAAMAAAQETLPVFWAQFSAPGDDDDQFKVKIKHPSDAYAIDYVWVEYLQETGETRWSGAVMIENGGNDRFRTGDTLMFDETDIVDWGYTEAGRLRGSYTTRAMLNLAPEANTDALRARFHDSPIPLSEGDAE